MSDVKLSVVFITYNHERYVERALRSACEQETDFAYEIVVGEDCSTDSTREILKKVAAEYPDRVRLLFRPKNFGRPTLNVYNTTMECRGKYLAYLEGDDMWLDKKKLQKQVDFLDDHPEYIACTHSCVMIDEDSREIKDEDILKVGLLYKWSGRFTYNDFKKSGKWPGHYATLVSRNIYLEDKYDYTILYRAHDFVDDALILLFLLIQGDIYRMNELMSAWRYVSKESGTNWNSIALKRNYVMDDCYLNMTMTKWVEEAVGLTDHAAIRCKKDFMTALKMYLFKPSRENEKFLHDMFTYNIRHVVMHDRMVLLPLYSIKCILKKILKIQ